MSTEGIHFYNIPEEERMERTSKENQEHLALLALIPDYYRKDFPITKEFTVSRDEVLGYRRYVRGDGNGPSCEILLTDEARDILRKAKKVKIKKEIRAEIEHIQLNPRGTSSIDPMSIYRSVNSFNQSLENKLGVPIAVKSSKRESLIKQFLYMKKLEKQWENLPDYIKNILRICKVYGVVRYRTQEGNYVEFLIMERVLDSDFVDSYITNSSGDDTGFDIEGHPLLSQIVEQELSNASDLKVELNTQQRIRSGDDFREFYRWKTLQQALSKEGLMAIDLAGRNLLYQPT